MYKLLTVALEKDIKWELRKTFIFYRDIFHPDSTFRLYSSSNMPLLAVLASFDFIKYFIFTPFKHVLLITHTVHVSAPQQ